MRYGLDLALLGALAALPSAQLGTVLEQHKISSLEGGFAGPLRDGDYFGSAVAALGDVDGDGVVDLAVGATSDDDGGPWRGAVWILFLERTGGVRSAYKISQRVGGFPGVVPDGAEFGWSLAPLGDVDGDGIPDLAVGTCCTNSFWVCLLRADGSVRFAREIGIASGIFVPPLLPTDAFAQGLYPVGDLDQNGVTDLAVGAPGAYGTPAQGSSLWIVRLNSSASAVAAKLVVSSLGGGGGPLTGWSFGGELAAADVDGDARVDLVTYGWRFGPPSTTSLLTLLLDGNQDLVLVNEIPAPDLALYVGLPQDASFGGLEFVGDLDGDGGPELCIGAPLWRASDTEQRKGGLFLSFLRRTGGVRRASFIGPRRGGFDGVLRAFNSFGIGIASLGDLDGDGVGDLAVGAARDPDGGTDRGAVWLLRMDGSPLRNGAGTNPLTLAEAGTPVMNRTWTLGLDCGAHAPGLALVSAFAQGAQGLPTSFGELLVDPASPRLFRVLQAHAGGTAQFALHVPIRIELMNFHLSLQGLCTGAPGPQLSNALDEILSLP